MKPFLSLLSAVVFLFPAVALGAVYIEYDTIKGESTPTKTPSQAPATTAPARVAVPSASPTPQEASTDFLIKLPGVDGESEDPTPTPKPQENQGSSIEPDEIDYDGDTSAAGGTEDINIGVGELTPEFGILLGGGTGDAEKPNQAGLDAAADILLEGLQEADVPAEQISLNYEKIKTRVRHEVKLFGIVPIAAQAEVDVDSEGRVKVKFPWWAFLATGKSDDVGEQVFTALSDVLKQKHDTIKSAISNVR